jgi:Cu(I)/Ag(I) efflux system membrane fusion protein
MDLVPVTKTEQAEGVVFVDEARRQLIGVRTAPVAVAPMRRALRAVGRVTYDESALTDVSPKVKGWITKLFVTTTGQRVARGQPLFTMYSPDLYAAEQDFLVAMRSGALPVTKASRQRLHLLGLDDAQIDAVASAGAPGESVSFPSPASGFVIEKNVVEGAAIEAGTRLYRIAALGRVWVEADVYERDLPRVRTGQTARVTLDHVEARAYEGKIAYVYPYVDDKTRSGRVRVELANGDLALRPGMYAQVEIAADLGPRLQVPQSAVVYTGPRRLVFVDLGQGRFRPTEIHVGSEADGMLEVERGLAAGDVVATSGVFLIAAEARIRAASTYWETDAGDDGGVR